jgi:SAM-dependent methyltransferase
MMSVTPNETSPSTAPDPQDEVNRRIYHAAGIHRSYLAEGLDRAETTALLKHQPAFAGRDVLDLGIGAGRTSRYLAPLAHRYVGTDYSPAMIAYVRTALPELDARLADMRDLSEFAGGEFDFVLAACNVLDAVSHADRLRAIGEVHRVLRPSGVFMFSSHNRGYAKALSGPFLVKVRNPATQAAYFIRYVRGLRNHARVGRLRREEHDYALLNDMGHDYAALHYYVDRHTQRRQLEAGGFHLLDIFDESGHLLADADDDSASPCLTYIAARIG